VTYQNQRLSWPRQEGVQSYKVLRNGQAVATATSPEFAVPTGAYAAYQVIAVDPAGLESFASEPLEVGLVAASQQYQVEAVAPKAGQAYKGFTGPGFVEISRTRNARLTIPVTVPETGLYALDFRYANGNGPTHTNNQCAIRTLRDAAGRHLGTVVLPQRGDGEWSNWGFSNPVLVRLTKGTHPVLLAYEPANANMNGAVNQAMLDYLRVKKVQ